MADADFATLIHTHRGYLLRVAVPQLRDSDLAENVVQDTLVAALQGAGGFSGRSSLVWCEACKEFEGRFAFCAL